MKTQTYQILLLVAIFCLSSAAQIRGSVEAVEKEEPRDLYYNYNNNRNYQNNGNGGGGNYGYGYYRRRYYNRYYQNKNNNNQNEATDDTVQEDDQGDNQQYDDAVNVNGTYYENATHTTSWREQVYHYEEMMEQDFYQWYESPPGDWTTSQWAWFGGALTALMSFVFCMCLCCGSNAEEKKEKRRKESEYDFDDYTSMDSSVRKGSSFVTKESDSTEFDDNATYDSIMRLRSD